MEELLEEMREAIRAAIPGVEVEVSGSGGHFVIDAVSDAFEGKRIIQQHRMVLLAIAHLMKGDNAPVHAIDKLTCRTP